MRKLLVLFLLGAGLPAPAQVTFGPSQPVTPVIGFGDYEVGASGDLDDDGDLDLLFGTDNDRLLWIENLDGGFATSTVIDSSVSPNDIVCADIDGDGDQDIAVAAASGGGRLVWFENLPGPVFAVEQVVDPDTPDARSLRAVDLDGDGDVDLVATMTAPNRVVWYENVGGFFGPPQVIANFSGTVRIGDLDGSGTMDLVVAASPDIVVIPQTASGFGSAFVAATLGPSLSDIALADLDGDQALDIVVASGFAPHIAWLPNQGGLAFGPANQLSTDTGSALAAFDADGDGDLDLAFCVGSPGSPNELRLYPNDGVGNFTAPSSLASLASSSRFLLAEDFDGDFDLDLLTSRGGPANGNVPAWFENFTPIVIPYPGSSDDLVLEAGVNGPLSRFPTLRSAAAGDALTLRLRSPGGTFDGSTPLIAAQLLTAGTTPVNPGGFPEAWVNPASPFVIVTLYDGAAVPFGPGTLPATGLVLGFTVPLTMTPLDVVIQGFALTASPVTGNPFFVASDAYVFEL